MPSLPRRWQLSLRKDNNIESPFFSMSVMEAGSHRISQKWLFPMRREQRAIILHRTRWVNQDNGVLFAGERLSKCSPRPAADITEPLTFPGAKLLG